MYSSFIIQQSLQLYGSVLKKDGVHLSETGETLTCFTLNVCHVISGISLKCQTVHVRMDADVFRGKNTIYVFCFIRTEEEEAQRSETRDNYNMAKVEV